MPVPVLGSTLLLFASSSLSPRPLRLNAFRTCSMPDELTQAIIGAAIKIHRKLGPGLLESTYEACLAFELEKIGLRVERQKAVPLVYETVKMECGFRADLVVEGRVVVELKCKEVLHPVDQAQLLSNRRLLDIPVGLLI
jgi:GxxExxY protein